MNRGLSERFLNAMRAKMESGRNNGRHGWDSNWEDCYFDVLLEDLLEGLLDEVEELKEALEGRADDCTKVYLEAADVANFAMMIADVALGLERSYDESKAKAQTSESGGG